MSTSPQADLPQGNVTYPNWNARPGFKIGASTYLDKDCWDLGVEYTWFQNEDNNFAMSAVTPDLVFPTFFPSNLTDSFAQAGISWNNKFNRVDLTLGRDCYLGRRFSCKPFFGFLGAWEKQSCSVLYRTASNLPDDRLFNAQNTQKWWGIGPYLGYKSAFLFVYDEEFKWSFFVDSGLSLPWGRYITKSMAYTDALYFSGKGTFWNMDAMLETTLGVRFEAFFPGYPPWEFLIQLGWEIQTWFGHNRMALWNTMNTNNNYSMQGLTLKAEVGF